MVRKLILEIPEEVYETLSRQAQESGVTPEELQTLALTIAHPERRPRPTSRPSGACIRMRPTSPERSGRRRRPKARPIPRRRGRSSTAWRRRCRPIARR